MAEGRFSNGFLLGLVIGGGLVFLLGTTTGKKILKTLSEEGLEGLTQFLEDLDVEDLDEELDEVEEEIQEEGGKNPEVIAEKSETKTESKPTKKRFFRKK